MMSDIAYIGLGSNLAEPIGQLQKALTTIHQHPNISIQYCSHLYSSAPMGPQDQPNYVNAVCKIVTSLSPMELLDVLQAIEHEHGRERKAEQWGPRTLDLDMLLFNNVSMKNERLTLPHYGMSEREFVLVPLFEISPDMIMQDGKSLAAWVSNCSLNGLKRLAEDIDYASIAA
ncbi:2-amino-4-hydroxy-6-hydroxymethyldihydropteridine diphosphokinase [Glaciecola sp. 2405UD65-10]|jgi:2-amino-4-hydroxy-6-hydroxymethyldihydropteridine diphosphokinase|uniref:2-amino-4-hydroxy-6- hydroxymethyldihydropteridine diphosphokinase n=1 Tax=Glaciecola sp. 2405UD65-10 TaxID=3397244 RepID=UPI003B5A1E65